MKKYFSLLIMTFVSIITNAQTSKLLMNDAKSYIGKIDDKAKMNIGFYSVFLDKDSPETYKVNGYSDVEGTKADFSGTIIFNSEKTKNSKDESKIYDLKFSEKGTGKHNGIFSGELSIKESLDKNQLKFEGTWTNYGNTMKFPVYFNN